MNQSYKTEQEAFWAGDFGNSYVERNSGNATMSSRIARMSRIFSRACPVDSVLELGANIGLNLQALKILFPGLQATAVEINPKAVQELRRHDWIDTRQASILEFESDKTFDFTFTTGVMIHIEPNSLEKVYRSLYAASHRYIGVIEYYNPTPVEVSYRGHGERLFKRDFAGEMLDMYPDLKLVDYGFNYHRDPSFPLDDGTWFLLEK